MCAFPETFPEPFSTNFFLSPMHRSRFISQRHGPLRTGWSGPVLAGSHSFLLLPKACPIPKDLQPALAVLLCKWVSPFFSKKPSGNCHSLWLKTPQAGVRPVSLSRYDQCFQLASENHHAKLRTHRGQTEQPLLLRLVIAGNRICHLTPLASRDLPDLLWTHPGDPSSAWVQHHQPLPPADGPGAAGDRSPGWAAPYMKTMRMKRNSLRMKRNSLRMHSESPLPIRDLPIPAGCHASGVMCDDFTGELLALKYSIFIGWLVVCFFGCLFVCIVCIVCVCFLMCGPILHCQTLCGGAWMMSTPRRVLKECKEYQRAETVF